MGQIKGIHSRFAFVRMKKKPPHGRFFLRGADILIGFLQKSLYFTIDGNRQAVSSIPPDRERQSDEMGTRFS
jgi:hypothetical protein